MGLILCVDGDIKDYIYSVSLGVKAQEGTAVREEVNFLLSPRAHEDLLNLATESHRSMTDLLRLGIALVKLVVEADRNGHKVVIASADGQALKEIVLPS